MAAAELPPLVYQTPANWCRCCSPLGRAIGEQASACCKCGGPVEPTALDIAATRAARNAFRPLRGATWKS